MNKQNKLFIIDEKKFLSNINYFLSNDQETSGFSKKILSVPNFIPDSFTIAERTKNPSFLDESERNSKDWIYGMIFSNIEKFYEEKITISEIKKQADFILDQVMFVLNISIGNKKISEFIYNQEFPDFVNNIITYCFTGRALKIHNVNICKQFNDLGYQIMSLVTKIINQERSSARDLLAYSIASGLVGLDMKGSASAASNYSYLGIGLKPLLSLSEEKIANVVYDELRAIARQNFILDYFDYFMSDLSYKNTEVVWFPDDYIESFIDLMLIDNLLNEHDTLKIHFVPKSSISGNDLYFGDCQKILKLPVYKSLVEKMQNERFVLNPNGPSMGCINLNKISTSLVNLIIRADLIFIKGCRMHEMVQGGINKITYTAYTVAREFSESVTGYDARTRPLLFFRNDPGEYSFWGFKGRQSRKKILEDGREIPICLSTTEEHETRKRLPISSLLTEIKNLSSSNIIPEYLFAREQEVAYLKRILNKKLY